MSAEPSAAGGQCCKRDSVRVLLSAACDADSVAKNTLGRVIPPREGPRHPALGGAAHTTGKAASPNKGDIQGGEAAMERLGRIPRRAVLEERTSP